jgi:hypothetical protein
MFLTENDISKTGMDFAEFLLKEKAMSKKATVTCLLPSQKLLLKPQAGTRFERLKDGIEGYEVSQSRLSAVTTHFSMPLVLLRKAALMLFTGNQLVSAEPMVAGAGNVTLSTDCSTQKRSTCAAGISRR